MRQGTAEGRGNRRLVILFIIASLVLLLAGSHVAPVANVLSPIFVPVESVVSGVADDVGSTISDLRDFPGMQGEIRALKLQNAVLLRAYVASKLARRENLQFARMLNFRDLNPHLDLQPARVIGWSSFDLTNTIDINVGSAEGIRPLMPVLSSEGFLVGHIDQVWTQGSSVMLLTDPNSAVGAMDLKTGARGLVVTPYGEAPRIGEVLTGQNVASHDLVVTSGLDDRYPVGLVIGQVTTVHRSQFLTLQYADIQTAANLTQLEHVVVIRNFAPSIPVRIANLATAAGRRG